MAWSGYDEFPPYVPVGVNRAMAKAQAAKLAKKGQTLSPVVIEGTRIARTFWGKAWCRHIEQCGDYANRLPRGRTYVRNGAVIDLRLEKGMVRALVSGSRLYEVEIRVAALPEPRWKALVARCTGKIGSVVALLTGQLPAAVIQELCAPGGGLFPATKELRLSCSCPDGVRMCKHLAAVLFGVGARLDDSPELFFLLRGVDQGDLIGAGGARVAKAKRPAIKASDLGEIFGIELAGPRRRRKG